MSMVASNTRRAVPRSAGLTGSFLIQLFDPLFVIGESVRYAANDAMSASETTLKRRLRFPAEPWHRRGWHRDGLDRDRAAHDTRHSAVHASRPLRLLPPASRW